MKIKRKGAKALAAATILALATQLSACNMRILDTTYHFDKVMINGEDASILMNVSNWKDYQGEQLQIITDNNFVLLTSSFDTACFSGLSENYSAQKISSEISDEVYDLSTDSTGVFNKKLFDTQWTFNKAIIFNGNNALIIPIKQWKDYDGEQLQVITEDGMTLLLSSFNSKLVYDEKSDMKAIDFAQMYVGSNGNVVDLSSDKKSSFNYDIVDTKYAFNKVLFLKDGIVTIMSIEQWKDYEGEQLQLFISDGPTMLTSAYATILLNDQNSELKASDIANYLSSDVVDISNEKSQGVFNKQILDLNYGFSSGLLSNTDSNSVVDVSKWNDYDGEQLQIILPSGDVILTTSMTLSLFSGGNSELNSSTIANYFSGSSGKVIDLSNGNTLTPAYNKTIIDIGNNNFKYALKLNGENVTILPIKSWKDYENSSETETYIDSDGETRTRSVKGEPNCEQIQLVLTDGTVLLTTAYNTTLVNNVSDIEEIAELFRGSNGKIVNLTSLLGEPSSSSWNKTIFDTRYTFDSAIISNNGNTYVVDIKSWKDYVDGEQLQLRFSDNTDMLTSYYNTTLVYSKTQGISNILSDAFEGKESFDMSKR